jgi:aspartyl-tRNA synthetase
MEKNKITIDQAKQQITEGFSSVLTREDVLHLLDCLEVNTDKVEFTKDMIRDLSNEITDEVSNSGMDLIDDYDLSMNGREVEVESITYNEPRIQSTIAEIIENFIENNK